MVSPLTLIAVLVFSLALDAIGQRNEAFIGYSEKTTGGCSDKLDDCPDRALHNGCLYEAFDMRRFCPISCNVERCTASGSAKKIKHRGAASVQGTDRFAKGMDLLHGLAEGHWRNTSLWPSAPLLQLSSLGVGTYLGDPDTRTDEAMEAAVIYSVYRGGWNVIDTASNYRYGRSEVSVGRALDSLLAGGSAEGFMVDHSAQDALLNQQQHAAAAAAAAAAQRKRRLEANVNQAAGGAAQQQPGRPPNSPPPPPEFVFSRPLRFDITRDMLFISTKAGFMEEDMKKALIQAGSIKKQDVVHGHCMHPACLEACLTQSLERLNVETVDLFYLHNAAEMQLESVGRETFMTRLLEAFKFLEGAKASGRIRSYGMATWGCFRVPPSDPGHLPLSEVVKLAELAAGGGGKGHGLQYIQLPINPAMPEAYSQRGWQVNSHAEAGSGNDIGHGRGGNSGEASPTLMELGLKLGIGFFASGPLMEAELLRPHSGLLGALDGIMELSSALSPQTTVDPRGHLATTATKLLQLARSTPGLMSALVGHKTREHVEENVKVSLEAPLGTDAFWSAHKKAQRAILMHRSKREK